jgi:hypothetical protein
VVVVAVVVMGVVGVDEMVVLATLVEVEDTVVVVVDVVVSGAVVDAVPRVVGRNLGGGVMAVVVAVLVAVEVVDCPRPLSLHSFLASPPPKGSPETPPEKWPHESGSSSQSQRKADQIFSDGQFFVSGPRTSEVWFTRYLHSLSDESPPHGFPNRSTHSHLAAVPTGVTHADAFPPPHTTPSHGSNSWHWS